jgi:uncharacterized protein (TIGR03382 family)
MGMGIAVAVVSLAAVEERHAAACGGCFRPPTETDSDVTDERMLLSVSPQQTTLYDQIRYVGNPKSFAWVLPIHGTVDVGLSADVLFASVDAMTQTQIPQPPLNCPVPAGCVGNGVSNTTSHADQAANASAANDARDVTVLKSQNVGPYATVQLSTNGNPAALSAWLAQNGYDIPPDVVPTLDAYAREGSNFLAMKLLPDQGVQSMRPVRVTTPGASLSLPLRMAAIGTGATVGITIWIVGDGRYEPQNFPFFHVDDSELVWDWRNGSSNYRTLRHATEDSLGGRGWEIESSISLPQDNVASAIRSGGNAYAYSVGYPESPAGQDYLPVTNPDGTTVKTAEQVRADDLTTLFAGIARPSARFTRIRSDISHAAMTADFVLQASHDQSELPTVRQVTQSINEQCPMYGSDCSIIGTGTPAQAAASGPQGGAVGGMLSGGAVGSMRPGGGSSMGFPAVAPGVATHEGGAKGSGCTATSTESSDLPAGFFATAGLLGVAWVRARRARRQ